MMKWLITLILISLSVLLLTPSTASADSSQDVEITATGIVVDAPGGFTVYYISDYEVGITWTKAASANNTMIRAKYGSMPESRTDGYLIYYGDGESCSDTGVSLDETLTPVYYRAWSETTAGEWSPIFAEDEIEGVGMTIFAVVAIILALMTMGFVFKNGILFLAATLGWVLFAFLMYGKTFDNDALNTGLLMFGGAMAIITAVLALNTLTLGRQKRVDRDEDEQRAYRQQVMNTTRRR